MVFGEVSVRRGQLPVLAVHAGGGSLLGFVPSLLAAAGALSLGLFGWGQDSRQSGAQVGRRRLDSGGGLGAYGVVDGLPGAEHQGAGRHLGIGGVLLGSVGVPRGLDGFLMGRVHDRLPALRVRGAAAAHGGHGVVGRGDGEEGGLPATWRQVSGDGSPNGAAGRATQTGSGMGKSSRVCRW